MPLETPVSSSTACLLKSRKLTAGAALLSPDVITTYISWFSIRKWHQHLCLPPGTSPEAAQMGTQSHERTSFIHPTGGGTLAASPLSLHTRAPSAFSRLQVLLTEEVGPESQKLFHLTCNPLSTVGLSAPLPSPRANLAHAHSRHFYI